MIAMYHYQLMLAKDWENQQAEQKNSPSTFRYTHSEFSAKRVVHFYHSGYDDIVKKLVANPESCKDFYPVLQKVGLPYTTYYQRITDEVARILQNALFERKVVLLPRLDNGSYSSNKSSQTSNSLSHYQQVLKPQPAYNPDYSWITIDLVNHSPAPINICDPADDTPISSPMTSNNEIFLRHAHFSNDDTILPKVHIFLGGMNYRINPELRGIKPLRVKSFAQSWLDELCTLLASGNSPFIIQQDEALASQINHGFSRHIRTIEINKEDCFRPDETIGYFFWLMLDLLNNTQFISPSQRMGNCSANESEGTLPDERKLKRAVRALDLIRHSEGFDSPDYTYNNQKLAKVAGYYLTTPMVTDGQGDENDYETKLTQLTSTYFEHDNLTDIKILFINAIKLLKYLREPGLIRHVETRREYKLKASPLTYQPVTLKQLDFISFKLHCNYKYDIVAEDKTARFIGRFNPQGQLLVKIPEKWSHIQQWSLESTPVENEFVSEFFPTLKNQYQSMLSMSGFTLGENDVGAVYGYMNADRDKYTSKLMAGMQVVGGGFNLFIAAALGATGVGLPLAGTIGFIGIDNIQAGLRTFFTDDATQTYGAAFLEWGGVPQGYGEIVYGLGDITAATKAGFLIQTSGQLYNIVKIKPIKTVQTQQVFKAEEVSISINNVSRNQHHVIELKSANDLAEEFVTYRRVQGGSGYKTSQERVLVDNSGNLFIKNKDKNLNISIDNGEHSSYFLAKNRENAYVIEFDMPKWFDNFVKENTIPQFNYKNNPANQRGMAPKLTDTTTPGTSIEFPNPWIEWIEESATNIRIIEGN